MPCEAAEPWLSVVMPLHHGDVWLEQTLASVASQDCTGIEFIAYDSSTDQGSRSIADRFAGRLDMRYRAMPDVKSWTAKTNLAVAAARAPYVALLHQDDLWLPGRVEAVRASIAAHPEAVLHLSPAWIIDSRSRKLGRWRCPLPAGAVEPQMLAERLLVQNFVAIPAPIIRRDAWSAVGGLEESLWYTGDWDLYLKLTGMGSAAYCPHPTTAFRVHGSSLTVTGSRDEKAFAEQLTTVIHQHLERAAPERRSRIRETALTSAQINCALAATASGDRGQLAAAALRLLRLKPSELIRYFHCSRIAERIWPRMRARLAGSF